MATRNIALTLTLGGTEQSISSINDLQDALRIARDELVKLEIGSEAFNKLSAQIQEADTKLKQLNDNAKGLKIDRNLNNVLRVGRLVANSFAAATAALGLFGIKSETLSAAQVRALQALTLATTVADIATQRKTISDLAATIRTVALTAATNASTVAMRTFYTVIAANPLGALLTAIGLVVGALIAFSSEAEEATDKNDDFNKSLERTQQINNQNIALLQAQGKDEITIQQERLKGAKRLLEQREAEYLRLRTINRFSAETAAASLELDKQRGIVAVETETLARLEREKTAKLEKDLEDARKERDEDRKKRLEEELRLRNALLKQTLDEQQSILAQTLTIEKFNAAEADIVKKLTARLQTLEGIKTSLQAYIPIQEEANAKIKEFNQELPGDAAYNDFKLLYDVIQSVFDLLDTPPTETTEELNQILNAVNEIVSAPTFKFLNKEAQDNLNNAVQNVKTLAFVINQLQQQGIDIDSTFIKEIAALTKELDQPFINPARELEIRQRLLQIEKDFVASYVVLKQQDDEYQNAIQNGNEETLNILNTNFAETARLYLTSGVQGFLAFEKFNVGVQDTNQSVKALKFQLDQLQGVEFTDYLLKNKALLTNAFNIDISQIQVNREKVDEITKEVQNRTFDSQRKYYMDVYNLEVAFAAQDIDITKLTYEQKLVLLQQFLEDEINEEDAARAKRQKERNDEIDSYANAIQEFQGIMNNLQQTFNDFYDNQFDKLEERNRILQEQIVGDTDLANQKRIDLEKQYQAEKLKLEKAAARSALRISLLQATANVATSITAALRSGIPVVSQIAAGINAAIGAAQVAIIASQLSQIDSLQRGGLVKNTSMRKGQGGLVVGPSHEYGGVRFGQRGLELEGGEAVINRLSTVKYGSLLNEINMAGGGKPIINNNFDDSRLLEALAKQRSEPIRAFVVEQDITNKQSLAKRLDQLSQV